MTVRREPAAVIVPELPSATAAANSWRVHPSCEDPEDGGKAVTPPRAFAIGAISPKATPMN